MNRRIPRFTRVIKRLVQVGVSALVFLADKGRDLVLASLGRRPVSRRVVLYYHGIAPDQRGRFGRQMDLLAKRAKPLPGATGAPPGMECHPVDITFDDGLLSYRDVALPELERRGLASTVFIPTRDLGAPPGWAMAPAERLMTHSEISEISRKPLVTVGSHGVSHTPFIHLSRDEAIEEFQRSRDVLESIVGGKIEAFSFPHGAYREEHVSMARDAGYIAIFSIRPRCAGEASADGTVGRFHADPSDWHAEFALKAAGAYRWLSGAHRMKRFMRRALAGGWRAAGSRGSAEEAGRGEKA